MRKKSLKRWVIVNKTPKGEHKISAMKLITFKEPTWPQKHKNKKREREKNNNVRVFNLNLFISHLGSHLTINRRSSAKKLQKKFLSIAPFDLFDLRPNSVLYQIFMF